MPTNLASTRLPRYSQMWKTAANSARAPLPSIGSIEAVFGRSK